MKIIAFIFLFIFSLVQVLPAADAVCNQSSVVLLIDEERGDDKKEGDTKVKKEFLHHFKQLSGFNQRINTAIHLAEKIHPSPCLEQLVPPPNFS